VVDSRQPQGQYPDLIEPADGAGQFGAAAHVGAVPQAIERAGTASLAGNQQSVKLRPLFARNVTRQGAPESAGGPGADAGHKALESRCPWQQHLLGHHPDGRAVEQHTRPVRASPAKGIQPTGQAEAGGRIGELAVAIALLDLRRVQPSSLGHGVLSEATWIGNPELLS